MAVSRRYLYYHKVYSLTGGATARMAENIEELVQAQADARLARMR